MAAGLTLAEIGQMMTRGTGVGEIQPRAPPTAAQFYEVIPRRFRKKKQGGGGGGYSRAPRTQQPSAHQRAAAAAAAAAQQASSSADGANPQLSALEQAVRKARHIAKRGHNRRSHQAAAAAAAARTAGSAGASPALGATSTSAAALALPALPALGLAAPASPGLGPAAGVAGVRSPLRAGAVGPSSGPASGPGSASVTGIAYPYPGTHAQHQQAKAPWNQSRKSARQRHKKHQQTNNKPPLAAQAEGKPAEADNTSALGALPSASATSTELIAVTAADTYTAPFIPYHDAVIAALKTTLKPHIELALAQRTGKGQGPRHD